MYVSTDFILWRLFSAFMYNVYTFIDAISVLLRPSLDIKEPVTKYLD